MEKLKATGAVRRLVLATMLAALSAGPLCGQDAGPLVRTLSLGDVFRQVEGANPNLQAGEAGVDAAREQTRQSLAELLPQIRAQASQVRQRTPQVGGIYDALDAVPPDPSQPGFDLDFPTTTNYFSAGLSVDVPLVNARNIANWKAAQLEQKATELNQVTNVQDTFAMAAELYFTHLRNLSRLEVIRRNIDRDQLLLNIAKQRFDAGVATDLDVTRAQAALARDRQDMLAQQTLSTQTRLALLRVMNLPRSTRLELEPEPVDEPRIATLPAAESVIEARPEHEAAQALLRRNKVAERAASWQRFPDISLIGEYGLATEVAFDGNEQKAWMIGISFSVPIWEGGRIHAEKQQARALVRQQEYLIKDIENAIGADYELAVEAVQQRWEELPFAREAVRLSEQELKFARERFEAGVADNADVVTAQASVAQANDAEVDAIHRYHLARIQLARVLGHVDAELTAR